MLSYWYRPLSFLFFFLKWIGIYQESLPPPKCSQATEDSSRCIETLPSITKTSNRLFLIKIWVSQRFKERIKYSHGSSQAFTRKDGFLFSDIFQLAQNRSVQTATFLGSYRICSIHCQVLCHNASIQWSVRLKRHLVFGSQLRWQWIEHGFECCCVLGRTSEWDQDPHRSSRSQRSACRSYTNRLRVILNFLS